VFILRILCLIMDKLSKEQRGEVRKTSSVRLRECLIRAEDTVIVYDRNAMTDAFAEILLTPPAVEPL